VQGATSDQSRQHLGCHRTGCADLASLPGAGYGQREHALANLREINIDERAAEPCAEQDVVAMFTACGGRMAA